jgi:hypothetical protein
MSMRRTVTSTVEWEAMRMDPTLEKDEEDRIDWMIWSGLAAAANIVLDELPLPMELLFPKSTS